MTSPAKITIAGPNDGKVLNVLGANLRILSGERTDQFCFADHPVPEGYAVPMHVHHDEDELFYIIEGELELYTPDGTSTARAGSVVHLPRGIAHGFANRSGAPAHMLVVTSPGNRLFRAFGEMDRAAREDRLAPPVIAAVLAAEGIDLV